MKKKLLVTATLVSMICGFFIVIVMANMPGPDPEALWKHITETSPYNKWDYWPDHQGIQSGKAPHGPRHKVFVNGKLLNSSSPPVQYGSIQVKENFTPTGDLAAITVMYKVEGYNPDAGDWFWVKYTPEGKADKSGKVKGCIQCHASRAKNDYILVHEFK